MNQVLPEEVLSAAANWKSYAKYKESGVEWLGEIPAHWGVTRIRRLARKGYRTFIDGDWIESPYITQEGVRLIQTGNIGIGEYCEQGFRYISEETFRSFRCTEVEPGDVLICRLADPVGRACLAPKLGVPMITSVDVCILKPDSNYDRRFLVYSLSSAHYLGWMAALCRGGTRDRVSRSMLGAIEFLTPPPPEQRAIAAFLDRETAKFDALVTKKERLIELLQEKRAAVISQAVTKGLGPDVSMKDSGVEWLGRIPAHWDVRRLRYVASILRGKFSHRPRNDPALYDGAYPFIQTGDVAASRKYITSYEQTLNEAGFAVSKQFPKGTLVMAIAANIGDLAILGFPACFPDSIVGFVPREGVVLEYLFCNLTAMRAEMVNAATENTQMNLNVERIGALSTALPPQKEQHQIVEFLDQETSKVDDLIAKVCEGIEKLKEYRTALISAAVTGKINVREETAAS